MIPDVDTCKVEKTFASTNIGSVLTYALVMTTLIG